MGPGLTLSVLKGRTFNSDIIYLAPHRASAPEKLSQALLLSQPRPPNHLPLSAVGATIFLSHAPIFSSRPHRRVPHPLSLNSFVRNILIPLRLPRAGRISARPAPRLRISQRLLAQSPPHSLPPGPPAALFQCRRQCRGGQSRPRQPHSRRTAPLEFRPRFLRKHLRRQGSDRKPGNDSHQESTRGF